MERRREKKSQFYNVFEKDKKHSILGWQSERRRTPPSTHWIKARQARRRPQPLRQQVDRGDARAWINHACLLIQTIVSPARPLGPHKRKNPNEKSSATEKETTAKNNSRRRIGPPKRQTADRDGERGADLRCRDWRKRSGVRAVGRRLVEDGRRAAEEGGCGARRRGGGCFGGGRGGRGGAVGECVSWLEARGRDDWDLLVGGGGLVKRQDGEDLRLFLG
ncbi:hypothetical protein IWZ01DRAFT_512813 [Phyllosticta capitalensis]